MPIEPVGQSAFLIIRPNALCLYNLSRHAPHNEHFHKSNGKQYCMLIQYIVGGYINPPLPVSVNLLGTKTPPRQATPPGTDAM